MWGLLRLAPIIWCVTTHTHPHTPCTGIANYNMLHLPLTHKYYHWSTWAEHTTNLHHETSTCMHTHWKHISMLTHAHTCTPTVTGLPVGEKHLGYLDSAPWHCLSMHLPTTTLLCQDDPLWTRSYTCILRTMTPMFSSVQPHHIPKECSIVTPHTLHPTL